MVSGQTIDLNGGDRVIGEAVPRRFVRPSKRSNSGENAGDVTSLWALLRYSPTVWDKFDFHSPLARGSKCMAAAIGVSGGPNQRYIVMPGDGEEH